jgi:hypothetical protein
MDPTHKKRYVRLFRGQPVDRAPFYLIMGPSNQAIDRWLSEGLNVEIDQNDPEFYNRTKDQISRMFGFDTRRGYMISVRGFIWPEFPEEVISETREVVYARTR